MPKCEISNDVEVYWIEEGDPAGPPIVWIHGGSVEESSHAVADIEPYWSKVRALYPDARGHGQSSKFVEPKHYTYACKANDLIGWLDFLGVEKALFGGASMGGALSLYVAAHFPERVTGVISISGPPFEPTPEDREWWAKKRHIVAEGRFGEFYTENVRLRMGQRAAEKLAKDPERLARATRGLRYHTESSLLALLDETYSRPNWVDHCSDINCPTLVISGSEDHYPTVAMSREVAETVSDSEFYVIDGGSHFPNRSHRGQVQPILTEFIDRVLFLAT